MKPKPFVNPKGPNPCKSELAKKIDMKDVLTRILATPLLMTVGEVVGLSKDVAGEFQALLKVKKPEQSSTVVFVEEEGQRLLGGPLITIPIEVDGHKVHAIIDSGSEINILNW
ncbi:hypothetical protein JAAARDRAFT_117850 [Jaapia argillacea MUCL 33604]|uniref:Uncharacterized protein n=1 Tax=Jaapia argillacea MUCL 33604 TaxID=933084 RepID=A0A067QAM7_9AGAM|nr:hypothetical protein JAAARDRAFT_117850 [Jaapia argillacea MUCL 33604]